MRNTCAYTVALLGLSCVGAVGTAHLGLPVLAPPFNSTWFRSFSAKTNLSVVTAQTGGRDIALLRWDRPEHFSVIFTYLPSPFKLSSHGDKVNISMIWRSSGDNICPASCYAHEAYCQCE